MSQIFDALLRSEVERAGEEPGMPAEATELLRSVEQRIAPNAAPVLRSDGNRTASESGHRMSFGQQALSAPMDGVEASTPGRVEWTDEIFDQFQSLPFAVPSESRLVSLMDKRDDPTAEAFRLLGVRLRDLRRTRPLKRVLITSTVPREGKSTVAANLACTLALQTEEKVLLLEGDVRRPSQSIMFNAGSIPGLCEYLQGQRGLSESIYRLEGTGLWLLPAGIAPNTPTELLQSTRLPLLMDQLLSWFDWVIVDSPPVLPLADTSVWMRMIDGILLVTRQGVTEKQQLEKGLQALKSGKLLGALLNCSHSSRYSSYYYRASAAS